MTQYIYKVEQGESEVMFSSLAKAKKYVKFVVMGRNNEKKWFINCTKCLRQIEQCRDETHVDETMKNSWIIFYQYGKLGDRDLDVTIEKFQVH